MWYNSENCSYDKYSEVSQNVRNISYEMMKEIADEINSYVREKEQENKKTKEESPNQSK